MPRTKKSTPAQIPLLELALKTAPCVPAIRQAVRDWVADGYKGATPTSKTLLNYWFRTDHRLRGSRDKFQYHYFQREAVETLVYLYEVAQARRHKDLIETYVSISPPAYGGVRGGYAASVAVRPVPPLLHQNGHRQRQNQSDSPGDGLAIFQRRAGR